MAVYFVTGKIRAGKGLFCSYIASQYYRAGLRVAANYLMDTEKLGPDSNNPVTVLPGIPSPEHLHALGRGCPEGEMERFGLLLLDEGGTWLNKPEKGQEAAYVNWFIHSGKMGWDVYIQVQDKGLINKDIFSATGEHLVVVERKDRIRFPFVSDILEMVAPNKYGVTGTSKGILPHLVSARIYIGNTSYKAKSNEHVFFFGRRYYGIHPTNLIFQKDILVRDVPVSREHPDGLKVTDMRAIYSALPGATMRKYNRLARLQKLLHITGGKVKPELKVVSESAAAHGSDAEQIAKAIKQMDKEESKKIRNKKLILYALALAFMFFWGRFAWSWIMDHFGGAVGAAPVTASVQVQNAPSQLPRPVTPDMLPLSSQWRLSGWMQQRGEGIFILQGSGGVLRYVPSSQSWTGLTTVFILDGEQVTFFSGMSDSSHKTGASGLLFSNPQEDK
ncbi:zonular occludens toxin family protein [Salmonella enterica subsp. enterica serovar Panama]|uniref:Zonular occludens toxin family protein n=1 Tax=Salmonella enterica subsp. enterica serovar Panama TaxID=29472 RepID=A0A751YXV3_SALET|nr:zonular occludens toxin family protein [Salmonella enterica]EGS7286548.1 zonular occludens toxin family protein [Salmonella enterica subsp. enterica serovar Panama]EGS7544449.1 zonular occludens toxin family protein [Salmonella enterica subsp. enterica serovar Panama]EHC9770544.1 zonular occludens toxin family protein [Salmonella enterica subsp. enterica serovar Panama]HAF7256057.1 zonular occludens toxin family protein [Salmonella enterica subsp. enterica serovar Panama]